SAPNFEAPADSNSDNTYTVEVTASDGQGGSAPLTLEVTVTDVNEAPMLTGATKVSVAENTAGTLYTATASDPENDALTYTLSGTDAALFNLDANSGALSFKSAPDFEAPADAGGNNVYDVILTASDGSLSSAPQALSITVTDVNEAPVFSTANKVSVTENTIAVTTLVATDADGDLLTYSLTGGADQALFTLDANSGALSFKSAPNFEAPADS
ncbi:Ig-like domain-containing protein, partial [Halomonas campaniensis]